MTLALSGRTHPTAWAVVALALGLVLVGRTLGQDTAVGPVLPERLENELRTWYLSSGREKQPPVGALLYELRSPETREAAADVLLALLGRLVADETSATAPWVPSAAWGQGSRNLARQLREHICHTLIRPTEPLVPTRLLVWLLDEQPDDHFRSGAMRRIGEADDAVASRLVLRAIARPGEARGVLLAALEIATDRHLPVEPEVLLARCHDLRATVRDAARALQVALGREDPGPFDPVAAMRTPELRDLLARITPMMLRVPDPEAELVDFAGVDEEVERGWVLGEEDGRVAILSVFGKVRRVPADAPRAVVDPRRAVADIAEWTRSMSADFLESEGAARLFPGGVLITQFRGAECSPHAVLMAHWLDRRGDVALAAELLLPIIDRLPALDGVLPSMRRDLGLAVGQQMLVAFIGDRDYATTARLATFIAHQLPDSVYAEMARDLVRELPERQDDFAAISLPTAEQWADLKASLRRGEAIRFLCRRLRLINALPLGQPIGGMTWAEPQYAEPMGMTDDAGFGRGGGKTGLINPWTELTGDRTRVLVRPRAGGLELGVADVPLLVPFLRERFHLLAASFWRDFHPDRTFVTTRQVIARAINDVMGAGTCDEASVDELSDPEIEALIASILAEVARRAR